MSFGGATCKVNGWIDDFCCNILGYHRPRGELFTCRINTHASCTKKFQKQTTHFKRAVKYLCPTLFRWPITPLAKKSCPAKREASLFTSRELRDIAKGKTKRLRFSLVIAFLVVWNFSMKYCQA